MCSVNYHNASHSRYAFRSMYASTILAYICDTRWTYVHGDYKSYTQNGQNLRYGDLKTHTETTEKGWKIRKSPYFHWGLAGLLHVQNYRRPESDVLYSTFSFSSILLIVCITLSIRCVNGFQLQDFLCENKYSHVLSDCVIFFHTNMAAPVQTLFTTLTPN